MRTSIYIVILIMFLSCNQSRKKTIINTPPNNISQKNNPPLESNNDFSLNIRKLPITETPYNFVPCNVNLLSELENEEPLNSLLRIKTDSLLSLKKDDDDDDDDLFYTLTIDKIDRSTSSYAPEYYHFLLKNLQEGTTLTFSNTYIFKRLKPIDDYIETLILITKIYHTKLGINHTKGIQFEVLTYDTKLNKSIARERLITIGIGLEDIAYYEGFDITNDNEIIIKGYMHLESESTKITRSFKINSNGQLSKEIIHGTITSKEQGETFIEEFSKEINH